MYKKILLYGACAAATVAALAMVRKWLTKRLTSVAKRQEQEEMLTKLSSSTSSPADDNLSITSVASNSSSRAMPTDLAKMEEEILVQKVLDFENKNLLNDSKKTLSVYKDISSCACLGIALLISSPSDLPALNLEFSLSTDSPSTRAKTKQSDDEDQFIYNLLVDPPAQEISHIDIRVTNMHLLGATLFFIFSSIQKDEAQNLEKYRHLFNAISNKVTRDTQSSSIYGTYAWSKKVYIKHLPLIEDDE